MHSATHEHPDWPWAEDVALAAAVAAVAVVAVVAGNIAAVAAVAAVAVAVVAAVAAVAVVAVGFELSSQTQRKREVERVGFRVWRLRWVC